MLKSEIIATHTNISLMKNAEIIKKDILRSIEIFNESLEKILNFSLSFGEYSLEFKKIIKELGFHYAFGQHSGVIDETKIFGNCQRFPINEKYGELLGFKTLMKHLPLKYNKNYP